MGRAGADPLTPPTLPIIRHEPFRATLESILGPVVIGGTDAPVRAKIPLDPVLAEQNPGQCRTPWHQDAIFRTNTDCDSYLSVQCWIPLVDATIERGCLHFIPYRFEEGLLPHYHGGGFLGIHPSDMPNRAPVPVEAERGDVVLWHNMTPHASFFNRGDIVRWSMDWRFYGAEKPNNVDELPTDHSEAGLPPSERTALACSFPSADFVLLDRDHPERECVDGQGMVRPSCPFGGCLLSGLIDGCGSAQVDARERFEQHRMGSEGYEAYIASGSRPARWRPVKEHRQPGPGSDWAVAEDPREWQSKL